MRAAQCAALIAPYGLYHLIGRALAESIPAA